MVFFKIASGTCQNVVIIGSVKDLQTNVPITNAVVKCINASAPAQTNSNGNFSLKVAKKENYKISFNHISYEVYLKEIESLNTDTFYVQILLKQKVNILDSIAVYARHKPETLVGKPNYSIFDFDFYEDKLLLLTAERNLSKAQLRLADYSGKVFATFNLPKEAGEALYFFNDYLGYANIVCKDSVYRVEAVNTGLLVSPMFKEDFNKYIEPFKDTAGGNYYLSDFWDKYPMFNYYYVNNSDTLNYLLQKITNEDLMKLFNLEYDYLPSRARLEARRMAVYYKTDKRIMAALMSGFTQSVYYEPLYAPLFIINDTICIFNHYNNYLFHYNKQNKILDSVPINYHHPKNWRDWKKQLFVDEKENKVYALFSNNGHHYIKLINHKTGKEEFTYKLKQHSAQKIKIKGGFVYYVYRPFDSVQEKFLYREKIEK